jgi:uncharacterized protein (UPF0264 family)
MKLLVSVSSAAEAEIALLAGADVIDAKDPSTGALGAVTLDVFADIGAVVGECRLLSAALGDATDVAAVARLTSSYVARGAQVLKIGCAGVAARARVTELLGAAVKGSDGASVVAVAYADASVVESIDATELIEIAARAGARGVLVDTADKTGRGLTGLWNDTELSRWIASVHACGLFAAVAGKLQACDLARLAGLGADVAGVRGAACVGGRGGRLSRELVQQLAADVRHAASVVCQPE